MLTSYPNLVQEWDTVLNKDININLCTAGMGKKVWWKCSRIPHHSWQATIANRTRRNSGCPICANQKICQVDYCNSLLIAHPEVVNEWDYDNNELKPEDYFPGSNKTVWWRCLDEHHIYQSMINNKIGKQRGCAVCSGDQICPIDKCNSLLVCNPDLAEEWHPTKNIDKKDKEKKKNPDEYTNYSNQIVWWLCRNCGHEWEASICNRQTRGCGVCANKKIATDHSNSLRELCPDLCQEWDYTANEIGPECFTYGSGANVWWQCPKRPCHKYQAVIQKRVSNGHGCPFCSHQRLCTVDYCNSLLNLYPKIAEEWHPTMNPQTAEKHIGGGHYKAWWQCSKNPEHIWRTKIAARITLTTNCPICNNSKLELEFEKWAKDSLIEIKHEYKFCEAKCKRCLRYDFYIYMTVF